MLLEMIHSPRDLAGMKTEELNQLAEEIRRELIRTVSKNGGHLASNLGAVELTLALHRVFDMSADKLIFDVGHQSYVHKMLTGRFQQFDTLRKYGGLSGFPKTSESSYDCFETGHASTSISAALGLARARDYQGENYHVVALVGDGALTGGMCYEALNDAGNSRTKMIVILNDNEMSIARNVGALSKYLTELRVSTGWQSAKRKVRHLNDIPLIGPVLYRIVHGIKKILKSLLLKSTDIGFFEALGFQYFGPIDGHDIDSMEKMFRLAKKRNGPCVIHVLTKKGNGYERAEEKPEAFHGTPPFYIETGDRISRPNQPSCGHVIADTLSEMTEKDSRIVAITAAMKLGTGLDHYEEKFKKHVLDVGIAEEHAVTMAAGLAAGGMRPYVAIYATFFQRCYDQLIHDVCLQKLPVIFLLDRSGIGGEDGATHHGVYSLAELLPVTGLTVLLPASVSELKRMIQETISMTGPCAICYPKSLPGTIQTGTPGNFRAGKWSIAATGRDAVLLAAGSMVSAALEVRKRLKKKKLNVCVVNCSTVKPLDLEMLEDMMREKPVFTLEEYMVTGGFGSLVNKVCRDRHWNLPVYNFGIGETVLQHGRHELLMKDAGLSPEQITDTVLSFLKAGNEQSE